MLGKGAIALIVALLVPVGTATAAASPTYDRSASLGTGDTFEWQAPLGVHAANLDFEPAAAGPCGKASGNYCDSTLIDVQVAPTHWETHSGTLGVWINWTGSPAELDLYVYRSDALGTPLDLVAAGPKMTPLTVFGESAAAPNPSGHYLVVVVYRAAVRSTYRGEALVESEEIGPEGPDEPVWLPPDVDDPPGQPDVLASDPALGFRSRSEPHIAQDPTNPDVLVAGSKLYNRDPDSLREYEFKIGTYVSFDRGRTWADLGPLALCPPGAEPPGLLDYHPCYPDEDPARDGTGAEDGIRGGGGDAGEEYITSDVWIQFDDEGNAYAMVLDSGGVGSGWGMTLHRWDSVSPEDLAVGTTWGPRLPIHEYRDPATRSVFLDDKNTFAVNNAGADGDGVTGHIVACWGQVATAKQVIVCSRSLDRGETWLPPVPVSNADALVIGVHVIADPVQPDTFYATWLHEALLDQSIEFAVSVDGGVTWVRRPAAATIDGLPRQFEGQAFRNLSIPIMGAAQDQTLYITYAATGHSLPLDDAAANPTSS